MARLRRSRSSATPGPPAVLGSLQHCDGRVPHAFAYLPPSVTLPSVEGPRSGTHALPRLDSRVPAGVGSRPWGAPRTYHLGPAMRRARLRPARGIRVAVSGGITSRGSSRARPPARSLVPAKAYARGRGADLLIVTEAASIHERRADSQGYVSNSQPADLRQALGVKMTSVRSRDARR